MLINITLSGGKELTSYSLEKNEEGTGYCNIVSTLFFIKDLDMLSKKTKKILTSKNEIGFGVPAIDFVEVLRTISDFSSTNKIQNVHLVRNLNTYGWFDKGCGREIIMSVLYLKGKALPRIKAIKTVSNDLYFVVKNKRSYELFIVAIDSIKCVIPLRNLVGICRNIKKHSSIIQPSGFVSKKKMGYTGVLEKLRGTHPLISEQREPASVPRPASGSASGRITPSDQTPSEMFVEAMTIPIRPIDARPLSRGQRSSNHRYTYESSVRDRLTDREQSIGEQVRARLVEIQEEPRTERERAITAGIRRTIPTPSVAAAHPESEVEVSEDIITPTMADDIVIPTVVPTAVPTPTPVISDYRDLFTVEYPSNSETTYTINADTGITTPPQNTE
jgi:hypothetical protein